MKELWYNSYDDMIKMFEDEEAMLSYFAENDVYINVRHLQILSGDMSTPTAFTQSIKKLFSVTELPALHNNRPYVKRIIQSLFLF